MKFLINLKKTTAALASVLSLCAVSASTDDNKLSIYEGIVATVNGEIITGVDLENRIKLALFSLGENAGANLRDKIEREVLSEMISEKLKWKCCKKFEQKEQTWVSEKEVENYFAEIAEQQNMSPEGLKQILKQRGIPKETLLDQITVNLSWMEYIRARYAKSTTISDSEIKRTMQEIRDRTNQKSFFVYKMFFPVNSPKEEVEVYTRVRNIFNMLNGGANFASLARQFSKSPDSGKGGELGWIYKGQVSKEEYEALSQMTLGNYKTVRTNHGYVILYLKDKRDAGLGSFTRVEFAQVIIPFGEGQSSEAVNQITEFAVGMKKDAHNNCHEFIKKAKASGVMAVSESTKAILESINPSFRKILANVPAGGVSSPVKTESGLVFFCMFKKQTEKVKEPTEEDIRNRKMGEKLEIFAEREIQNLKKIGEITLAEKYKKMNII